MRGELSHPPHSYPFHFFFFFPASILPSSFTPSLSASPHGSLRRRKQRVGRRNPPWQADNNAPCHTNWPGAYIGSGGWGVQWGRRVFSHRLVFWDVRAEVRKVVEEVRGGEGRWSARGCGGWECHLSLWMRCWMSRVRTCLHEAERIGCERRPRSPMLALLLLLNPHW